MADRDKPGATPNQYMAPPVEEKDWVEIEFQIEKELKRGMREYRDEIEQEWRLMVYQTTNTTTDAYLAGLTVEIQGGDTVVASVDGWLPIALETGVPRFDMKPGLLKGRISRVIRLANGNFRTVSINSPKDSWWHPGIQARDIASKIEREAPKIMEEVFNRAMARVKV